MKLDNFTTARCRQCGWIKQFQPGKDYNVDDFVCNCKTTEEKTTVTKLDKLKEKATEMGIDFKHNIGEAALTKKIKEAENGNEG